LNTKKKKNITVSLCIEEIKNDLSAAALPTVNCGVGRSLMCEKKSYDNIFDSWQYAMW
jgi:hypothetical protein